MKLVKVNWWALLLVGGFLIALNTGLGVIARGDNISTFAKAGIKGLQTLSRLGLGGIVILVLLTLGDRVWKWLNNAVAVEEQKEMPSDVKRYASGIDNQLQAVEAWVSRVESNGSDALQQLSDLELHASTVVSLISSAMERYRITLKSCELLEKGIRALAQNDPADVAEVAGQIRDSGIAQLMFETTANPENEQFRAGVLKHISMQKGALLANADAYQLLALRWLERITILRTQAKRLEAEVFVLDATGPLALLQSHLFMAEQNLNDNMLQPGMRQLPGVQRNLIG